MSWIKKALFLLVGWSVLTIICVVLLELFFGSWLSKDPWEVTKGLNIIRNKQLTYATESLYGKDMASVIYSRDSNGLRGGCPKVADIDIVTIGGSTTDQRYVPDGKTYQDVLQTLLTNELAAPVCVSNAGVDGHSTFGHLASFDNWFPLISNLKPKYFLFYVGINDAGFVQEPRLGFDRKSRWGQIREKSALFGLLRTVRNVIQSSSSGLYAQHNDTPASKRDYVAERTTEGVDALIKNNTEKFRVRFDKLLTQAKNYGAAPICVSQPHLFTADIDATQKGVDAVFHYKGKAYNGLDFNASLLAINNTMMVSCMKAGGFFIDVRSKYFEVSDFYDHVHLGPSGARKLGTYLYDEFLKQGLLSRLN